MAAETPAHVPPKRGVRTPTGEPARAANETFCPPDYPTPNRSPERVGGSLVISPAAVITLWRKTTAIMKEIIGGHMGLSEVAHPRSLQRKPLSAVVRVDTLCLIDRWEK